MPVIDVAKHEAAKKLEDFIVRNFGGGEVFTYSDLPPVKELCPEFLEDYKKRYGAAEASGTVMLSSANQIMLGELLQSLSDKIEVVGYCQFKLRYPVAGSMSSRVLPLVKALKGGSVSAQYELRGIGEPAVEPLIQALKDKDAWVRMHVAQTLGWIGDARAVDPLVQALKDDERWDVRRDAAEALGNIGDARALQPLTQALKDDPGVARWDTLRGAITKALQKIEAKGSKK
jgi:hypothetical protein